jgi:hypothetical protein
LCSSARLASMVRHPGRPDANSGDAGDGRDVPGEGPDGEFPPDHDPAPGRGDRLPRIASRITPTRLIRARAPRGPVGDPPRARHPPAAQGRAALELDPLAPNARADPHRDARRPAATGRCCSGPRPPCGAPSSLPSTSPDLLLPRRARTARSRRSRIPDQDTQAGGHLADRAVAAQLGSSARGRTPTSEAQHP